jgi:hypothetical protein
LSSTKLENRRAEQVLPSGEEDGTGGDGKRKGGKRVNTVQKCVHVYVNAKMITFETIPGIRGRGDKRECDIFDCENLCKAIMYPQHNNKGKK